MFEKDNDSLLSVALSVVKRITDKSGSLVLNHDRFLISVVQRAHLFRRMMVMILIATMRVQSPFSYHLLTRKSFDAMTTLVVALKE
jgi:hypothetical protein